MSRKLPKATVETLEGIRLEAASAPKPVSRTPKPAKSRAKGAKAAADPQRAAMPLAVAVPASRPPEPAAPAVADVSVDLRRSHAREAVARYTTYAAVGGLIPLAIVDTLGVMAAIAVMIREVAAIYGETLERERARTLVASLAGGLGQFWAGAATTTTLAKLVPGANLVGAMMSSIAAATLTRAIGRAFILHFETGGTALQFDAAAVRAYFAAESRSQPTSRQ